MIEPQCAGELQTAVRLCRDTGVRFDVIGGGSNLLISDKGIPWAVISTRKMQGITCHGGTLRAMCGVPLPLLLQAFAKAGDNSLLFAAGIPGTVGGGLFMNAGTGGHGVLDAVYSVCVLDADTLEFKTVFQKECNRFYYFFCFLIKSSYNGDMLLKFATISFNLSTTKSASSMVVSSLKVRRREPCAIS